MKRNLLEICREFLVVQMNHLTFMAVGITILGVMKQENAMFLPWLFVSIVPFLHYFLRLLVKKIYIFFPLQVLTSLVCIFLPMPNIVFKVLVCISVVLYAIWSAVIKVKGEIPVEDIFHPAFTVIVIGVTSMVQSYFGYDSWTKYFMLMIFIGLLCYFLHMYIEKYQHFIHVNQYSASNIPEKAIFKVGFKQTCLYTITCLVIVFLSANLNWFAYAFKTFLYVVLWIVRTFLDWLGGESTMDTLPEEELPVTDNSGFSPPVEGSTTYLLWRILEYIVLPAVSIAIIVAIFYGIYKVLKYIFLNFRRYTFSEETFNGGVDIRESVEIEKSDRGVFRLFSFKNNRDKVRKLFKRYILKEKKLIIGDAEQEELRFITAKECCEKLTKTELSRVYDKARYSESDITAEDLKVLKQI